MINWRNGKAGFVGGLKYAIKGVFQFIHSKTSVFDPKQSTFAVTGPIDTFGKGVSGEILSTGKGVLGPITSTFSVVGTITTLGRSVSGTISPDGQGVNGEIKD